MQDKAIEELSKIETAINAKLDHEDIQYEFINAHLFTLHPF